MAKRSAELNTMRDKWEIQYRKGVIQLMVLAVLNQGESYGYEICKIISEITEEVIDVPIGTVYPLLGRFQQDGFQYCGGGAFAIGAGNMNKIGAGFIFVVGVGGRSGVVRRGAGC